MSLIAIPNKGDLWRMRNVVFDSHQNLIQEMMQAMGKNIVKYWVAERLASLHECELERARYELKKENGIRASDKIADDGQCMEKR